MIFVDACLKKQTPYTPVWLIAVTPVTFVCSDTEGNEIFSGVRGVATDADFASAAPEIKNFTLKSAEKAADGRVKYVYERTGVTVTT